MKQIPKIWFKVRKTHIIFFIGGETQSRNVTKWAFHLWGNLITGNLMLQSFQTWRMTWQSETLQFVSLGIQGPIVTWWCLGPITLTSWDCDYPHKVIGSLGFLKNRKFFFWVPNHHHNTCLWGKAQEQGHRKDDLGGFGYLKARKRHGQTTWWCIVLSISFQGNLKKIYNMTIWQMGMGQVTYFIGIFKYHTNHHPFTNYLRIPTATEDTTV